MPVPRRLSHDKVFKRNLTRRHVKSRARESDRLFALEGPKTEVGIGREPAFELLAAPEGRRLACAGAWLIGAKRQRGLNVSGFQLSYFDCIVHAAALARPHTLC